LFDPYLVTEHFMISALAGVITPVFFAIGLCSSCAGWKQADCSDDLAGERLIFLSIIGAFPPPYAVS
jgi:hypothetical protein